MLHLAQALGRVSQVLLQAAGLPEGTFWLALAYHVMHGGTAVWYYARWCALFRWA